jgi:hypothetical protein
LEHFLPLTQKVIRQTKDRVVLGKEAVWTGFIAGKRTTKTISKQQAEECERRIKNYRALQHKLDQIAEDALVNAPWNQSPDKRALD